MDVTADELAGVVDLFGGLTREELERALSEVAYRDGGASIDDETIDTTLEEAIEGFVVVEFGEGSAETGSLYVAGPTAFPTTPEHGEDLPYILDLDRRTIDRETLGTRVTDRLNREIEAALAAGDAEQARWLVDVSYDVESWAPVTCTDQRERLDELVGES